MIKGVIRQPILFLKIAKYLKRVLFIPPLKIVMKRFST
jgi:hypothetical protein